MYARNTGAPKLINSDLFLEKRATVPINSDLFLEKRATVPMVWYCSTFFQKQITINKFWGTCG